MSQLIWPAIALLALLALYAVERDTEEDEPVDGEGPGRIGEDGE